MLQYNTKACVYFVKCVHIQSVAGCFLAFCTQWTLSKSNKAALFHMTGSCFSFLICQNFLCHYFFCFGIFTICCYIQSARFCPLKYSLWKWHRPNEKKERVRQIKNQIWHSVGFTRCRHFQFKAQFNVPPTEECGTEECGTIEFIFGNRDW